jgi:hypothetical protein
MRSVLVAALIVVLGLACRPVEAKNGAPSRLFPYYAEDTGVAVLGEVAYVGTRSEIVASETHYKYLLSTGIADAEITDGRLAVVRFYCCGGKISEQQEAWAYVPPALTVEQGDLVELRMGRVPRDVNPGVVNTVTVVRQKSVDAAGGPCRWEPDNPALWMRVVYCEGMEQQGWVQRENWRKLWFRPAGLADAPMAPDASSPAAGAMAVPAVVASASPEPTATTATAPASDDCVSVVVARGMVRPVMLASAGVTPPLDLRLQGSPEAATCRQRLELTFGSVVDRSSQARNQTGAAVSGLAGLLVGSITPWPCPTMHSLTGQLSDGSDAEPRTFVASKEQKRVGTMLACAEVEQPNESIATELALTVLRQVANPVATSPATPSPAEPTPSALVAAPQAAPVEPPPATPAN